MRALILLAVVACLMGLAPPARAQSEGPRIERVVMLMRHGVRPPTRADVTPVGVADAAWPAWDAPYGHLTEHGFQAIQLLARYDRAWLARHSVLPREACPRRGAVAIVSDSDQRTIRTGDALILGLAPGCGLANVHNDEGVADPLFSPLDEPSAIDRAAAERAILADIGSLSAAQQAHRAEFDALQRVLGCCSAAYCARANLAEGCRLADVASAFAGSSGAPKLDGPMDFGPTAAQSLMLEYVEGMPMSAVGWGRASRADIEAIMGLHAMKGDVLQRPLAIAAPGGGPLLQRMMRALIEPSRADGGRMTILVGHDTNISHVAAVLGVSWQVDSYPANTPPPGSALGLVLLRDSHGHRIVRAFYRSQTMDQMRALTPLTDEAPPSFSWLPLALCGSEDDCTPVAFARFVRARLAQ